MACLATLAIQVGRIVDGVHASRNQLWTIRELRD